MRTTSLPTSPIVLLQNKANEIILLLWNIHKQQHRIPGARERETTDEFEEAVSGERRRLLREQLNASSLARRVDVVPVAAAAFVLHLPSRIAFKRKKKKKKKNGTGKVSCTKTSSSIEMPLMVLTIVERR
jgi:hypothetical protein